eukprot:764113-Hanusia_phi.AAC.1
MSSYAHAGRACKLAAFRSLFFSPLTDHRIMLRPLRPKDFVASTVGLLSPVRLATLGDEGCRPLTQPGCGSARRAGRAESSTRPGAGARRYSVGQPSVTVSEPRSFKRRSVESHLRHPPLTFVS